MWKDLYLQEKNAFVVTKMKYEKHDTKVFVFDFDLTLTSVHTNGNPSLIGKYMNDKNKTKLIMLFRDIKKKGYGLHICSRGDKVKLQEYCDKHFVFSKKRKTVNKKHYLIIETIIDKIFGSDESIYPLFDSSKTEKENNVYWAHLKAKYLLHLSEFLHISKDNIYFFDDTEINVKKAITCGFKNSFLLDQPKKNVDVNNQLTVNIEKFVDVLEDASMFDQLSLDAPLDAPLDAATF